MPCQEVSVMSRSSHSKYQNKNLVLLCRSGFFKITHVSTLELSSMKKHAPQCDQPHVATSKQVNIGIESTVNNTTILGVVSKLPSL